MELMFQFVENYVMLYKIKCLCKVKIIISVRDASFMARAILS